MPRRSTAAAAPAGERLSDFYDAHRGESVIVCGCGESLNSLAGPPPCVTIGVNDVGRRLTPTYLVVVNPPGQFDAERLRYIEKSGASVLFTQLPQFQASHPRVVMFRLGSYGATESAAGGDVLHYTQNSPYVAASLALYMGARRIGLIGVDFTDGDRFGRRGSHPLSGRVAQIDREYARLAETCAKRGVELINLSAVSRLDSLPREPLDVFLARAGTGASNGLARAARSRSRVFAVNYRFLACGDVFTEGLRRGAADAGAEWADAHWDDPALPSRIAAFEPDLLLVVHGRRFVQQWRSTFGVRPSAVWLLDEPYEVDDTARFSGLFDHVFVNDPATLDRHRQAAYLPVCYDPHAHSCHDGPRKHDVGFVGGANATRERLLGALAGRDLLDYVVGGPWRDRRLIERSLSPNLPPAAVAGLYRDTKIVVNVFRDCHHFNRQKTAATSLNPRIYEALACGALVVSERRPEIEQLVPELPTFDGEDDLAAIVAAFLGDPARLTTVARACAARVADATYSTRLRRIMDVTLRTGAVPPARRSAARSTPAVRAAFEDVWEVCGPVTCSAQEGGVALEKEPDSGPGAERGLVTRAPCDEIDLRFEALIGADACFIAKINQADQVDQTTNSYHLFCDGARAYLARHNYVFGTAIVPRERWVRLRLKYERGALSLFVDDKLTHHVRDRLLPRGFAFLGVKGGRVQLREIEIAAPPRRRAARDTVEATVLQEASSPAKPRVSIVSTVCDRVACLRQCIRSVRRLAYGDYEHIVVSDGPPATVVAEIARVVADEGDARTSYLNLARRFNNWGIAPAAVGLRRARGEYVCFLSDDNGYTPDHFAPLVRALDRDPQIGFAYSSCQYDGRFVLQHPPAPGRIDLGQPLFRRELFATYLDDDLPFDQIAWDWALIDTFIKRGVRWKHVNNASFLFRLAKYPQHMVGS